MSVSFAVKVFIVLLFVGFTEYYFLKKIVKSIKIVFPAVNEKKLKRWKNLLLLILNAFPVSALLLLIVTVISGSREFLLPQSSIYDYAILYPFWIGMLIVIQTTLIFILFKIIFFAIRATGKNDGKLDKLESFVFLSLLIIFLIYVPARVIYDYNNVEIREVKYFKNDLPEALNGFKITFISDIQADRYTDHNRLKNFIEKVNGTNPDLVLIAGDMITNTPDYIETSAEHLGKLHPHYGVYSCVGDHDNWAYRFDNEKSLREVKSALKKYNILMLDNDRLTIDVDTASIGITFATNTYVERIKPEVLNRLVNDSTLYDLKIFLTHQPRNHLIEAARKSGYDLYLCGHTHGGQMTFLFPFYNISPTQVETPYMRGNFKFGKMLMIVTRGLGMSLAPVRYNATPEITVITLYKR